MEYNDFALILNPNVPCKKLGSIPFSVQGHLIIHVTDFAWEATKRPVSLQIDGMSLIGTSAASKVLSNILYTASSSYMEPLGRASHAYVNWREILLIPSEVENEEMEALVSSKFGGAK
ncbi:hypothetical protein N7507_000287 [Penicillium longicatenatum]|nr:hypothetical protein N7507_000287 [Penicillium longicatenatum]